jgi:predicted kinase
MNKLILALGISGSGKTTWAKQWVKEDPIRRVRLNYDDIRCMLGEYWVPEREPLVKYIFDKSLVEAMELGYDIVIDNMSNLNSKHQAEYAKLVESHNDVYTQSQYEIEHKWFITSVDVCIERDKNREVSVGEKVIRQQWRKYRNEIIQHGIKEMLSNQVKNNPMLPHCILVDMDATLCFNTNGRPFYGPGADVGMRDDIPNTNVIDLVKAYCTAYNCDLIILTGRDESCREATMDWLNEHDLHPTELLMRPDGSYLRGDEQKKLIYEIKIKDKYNVDFVIDDSDKVVKMYRDLGLTVLQPNEGKF